MSKKEKKYRSISQDSTEIYCFRIYVTYIKHAKYTICICNMINIFCTKILN